MDASHTTSTFQCSCLHVLLYRMSVLKTQHSSSSLCFMVDTYSYYIIAQSPLTYPGVHIYKKKRPGIPTSPFLLLSIVPPLRIFQTKMKFIFNTITSTKTFFKKCRGKGPKPQKLGAGMAVSRQDTLHEDYTNNPITILLIMALFSRLCYAILGNSIMKQKKKCRDGGFFCSLCIACLACTLPSLHLVSVVLDTAYIPVHL